MEKMASLNFMKRNYNILKEDNMFFSQRDGKTRDNGG